MGRAVDQPTALELKQSEIIGMHRQSIMWLPLLLQIHNKVGLGQNDDIGPRELAPGKSLLPVGQMMGSCLTVKQFSSHCKLVRSDSPLDRERKYNRSAGESWRLTEKTVRVTARGRDHDSRARR